MGFKTYLSILQAIAWTNRHGAASAVPDLQSMPAAFWRTQGWLLVLLCSAGLAHAAQSTNLGKYVTIQTGDIPVILSAPHGGGLVISGVPVRAGPGVRQFTTLRDVNTAELAEKIAARLEHKLGGKPFLIIARFQRKYVDVNRPAEHAFECEEVRGLYGAYHVALAEACTEVRRRWTHGLLLDIHGQSTNASAIYRGTASGRTVRQLLQRAGEPAFLGASSVLGQLSASGIPILPSLNLTDPETILNGGYIVNTYGSHHANGVDAIQLEFGTNLRKKAALEKTAEATAAAVAGFCLKYLPAPN